MRNMSEVNDSLDLGIWVLYFPSELNWTVVNCHRRCSTELVNHTVNITAFIPLCFSSLKTASNSHTK